MSDVPAVIAEVLSTSRAVPAAAVLTLLWLVESIQPRDVYLSWRLGHAVRNLALAVINGAVLFFTLGFVSTVLSKSVVEHRIGLLNWLHLPTIAQLIAGCFVLDGWTYFWHRGNHWFPFLWRFHRVHHSDAEMDVTTSARFHVGELAMAAIFRMPVIVAFGLSPETLVVHETILLAVSQFHHSNISLGRFDSVLRLLIVTPTMHRIHHSRNVLETNSNYSSILSLWDRLFGSHRNVNQDSAIRLGLDEFQDDHWQTISGMLKTPFANVATQEKPTGTPTAES